MYDNHKYVRKKGVGIVYVFVCYAEQRKQIQVEPKWIWYSVDHARAVSSVFRVCGSALSVMSAATTLVLVLQDITCITFKTFI